MLSNGGCELIKWQCYGLCLDQPQCSRVNKLWYPPFHICIWVRRWRQVTVAMFTSLMVWFAAPTHRVLSHIPAPEPCFNFQPGLVKYSLYKRQLWSLWSLQGKYALMHDQRDRDLVHVEPYSSSIFNPNQMRLMLNETRCPRSTRLWYIRLPLHHPSYSVIPSQTGVRCTGNRGERWGKKQGIWGKHLTLHSKGSLLQDGESESPQDDGTTETDLEQRKRTGLCLFYCGLIVVVRRERTSGWTDASDHAVW